MKKELEGERKKFSELSYFKEDNYQKIPDFVNGVGFDEEFKVEDEPFLKELKPQKSYIQISRSGMFKTHSDLFSYTEHEIKARSAPNMRGYMPPLPGAPDLKNMKFLLEDERFKFALYELNKLNGIAEVTPKSIKFYNGDEYVFQNGERSFETSLGSLKKFMKIDNENQVKYLHFYWKRFFNESLINNFDEDFFETEIKGKLTEKYLRNGKRTFLKFGDGST